jgi:signal transduction histidine kinase
MSLVKTDDSRMSFQFQNVELDKLLRGICEDTQILAEPKEISVTLSRIESVSVHGDPSRLQQLFLNLAENAVKYTPPGGRINLSLERVNGSAIVQVSDTGIGIPSKDQSKIFDRFYRVERQGSGSVGGSGLGLAIARWIAEAHHGSIEVRSRVRRGSTFIVKLPISRSSSS